MSAEQAAGPSSLKPPGDLSEDARRIAENFDAADIAPAARSSSCASAKRSASSSLGLAAYAVAPGLEGDFEPIYLIPLVIGPFLTVLFVQAADGYDTATFRLRTAQIGRVLAAWTLVFAGFAVVGVLLQPRRPPRSGPGSAPGMPSAPSASPPNGLVLGHLVRSWTREGRLDRRALIVGGGEPAADLIRTAEARPTTTS